MDVSSPEPHSDSHSDQYLLLLEQMERDNSHVHIIDVTRNDDTSSSSSNNDQPPGVEFPQYEDRLSQITSAPTYQEASSNILASRSSSLMRRGDVYSRHRRSPFNSGLWISVELIVTVSQIIVSIVVLSLSTNENPQAPLFVWIVGYATGCVATLPLLYWRFHNRYRGAEQESTQSHQSSSDQNPPEPTSYTAISITPAPHQVTNSTLETVVRNPLAAGPTRRRFHLVLNPRVTKNSLSPGNQTWWVCGSFKMALDCFFAVWFVVGNVWIFGGQTSPSDAPKLYRLCIVFLTFSCIGYAMPFILCATVCCCLPCIISVLGIREDFSQTRGATTESINSLPTYKFKLNRNEMNDDQESNEATAEGGLLAAGTEKECSISEEDAVCSICLTNYSDNDEMRELTCLHFFHVQCVDKWLKINASCPLCKSEVGETSGACKYSILLPNLKAFNGSLLDSFN